MNRIKEVLEQKGIKQTWLAEKLGKSYNVVNGYVQNRQQPRLEVLYEIAKILDVEVKELLINIKNKETE
jgi:putative transcriptional regulator